MVRRTCSTRSREQRHAAWRRRRSPLSALAPLCVLLSQAAVIVPAAPSVVVAVVAAVVAVVAAARRIVISMANSSADPSHERLSVREQHNNQRQTQRSTNNRRDEASGRTTGESKDTIATSAQPTRADSPGVWIQFCALLSPLHCLPHPALLRFQR